MADVRPFAALRPRAGLAPRVAAVPYDVVNAEEARALATDALSFLHVSRAEIDLPPDTDPYADAVYARAVRGAGGAARVVARGRVAAGGLPVSPDDGRARPDRRRRGVLGRRVPARPGQEAREDAAGQGERSDAAHHRDAGPERAGAADVSAPRRRRRRRRGRTRGRAALRVHRARRHRSRDLADGAGGRRGDRRRRSARCRRSTSPTGTIAPPARRAPTSA